MVLRRRLTGCARLLVGALALVMAAAPASAQRPAPWFGDVHERLSGRGWFGFAYTTETRGQRTEMVVQSVVDGSGAAKAGLRAGDRIVRLDGQEVSEPLLERVGREVRAGEMLVVRVRRDGSERDVRLRADRAPERLVVLGGSGRGQAIAIRTDTVLQVMEVLLDSVNSAMGRFHVFSETRPVEGRSGTALFRPDSGSAVYGFDAQGRPFTLRGTVEPTTVESLNGLRAVQQVELERLRRTLRAQGTDSAMGRELEALRVEATRLHAARSAAGRAAAADVRARELLERQTAGWPGAAGGSVYPSVEPARTGWLALGEKAAAGARFEEIGPAFRHAFGVSSGLLVLDVAPGTLAARAGLRVSDVVTAAGGASLATLSELRVRLSRAGPDGLPIEVVREKKRHSLRLPVR